MKIVLLCVGKIKEKFYSDAINEYQKRLRPYSDLSIVEVEDEKDPHIISKLSIKTVLDKEANKLFNKINKDDYVIALCIDAKQYNSEEFATMLEKLKQTAYKRVVFVIGGSNGLNDALINRANLKLSFSKLTFPHQLMRVILMEQIYRAHKINSNEPYHK